MTNFRKSLSAGLLILASALPAAALTKPAAQSPDRPNIVIIYADDMGRADPSAFGNPYIKTRAIDSLAAGGTKFSNGYVTAPLCSPSRAGLITGRYQQRFGFEHQVSSDAFPDQKPVRQPDGSYKMEPRNIEHPELRGVPVTEANIAEILRPQGYRTGVIGKWHLGYLPQFQPQNRGFDYSFVFYGNTSMQYKDLDDPNYISRKVDFHDELPQTAWTRDGINALRRNGKIVDVDGYLVWRFRDEAVKFIEDNKDHTFFLYLPINAPVPPLQVPKSYYDKLSNIPNENLRAYQAFLLAYDDAVGAVLDKLKTLGLEKNTIVIFASDNGNAATRPGSNAPFSGGKFNTLEGGIRTPYIIKWPGHIKAGATFDGAVSTLDILPTLIAATHTTLPAGKQTDGVDLLPYLGNQKSGSPHDVLYWKLGNYAAIRKGNWKLYFDRLKPVTALYDLAHDEQEKTDLSASQPELVRELKQLHAAWEATLPPPNWVN
jgi:arylsulfatase A-like enzyme